MRLFKGKEMLGANDINDNNESGDFEYIDLNSRVHVKRVSAESDTIPESQDDKENEEKKENVFLEILKYFVVFVCSLIFWEFVMLHQLGGITFQGLFFLFFIPAEAMLITSLCGIGNRVSSRIMLPLLVAVPCIYYVVQTVYIKNFGSLFSISMVGMGEDALDNFGWALIDAIENSVLLILLILLPVFVAIIISATNILKIKQYKAWIHFVVAVAAIVLWFAGVLGIRAFGNDRLSPYYMLTSNSAVTDSAAKKIGTLTTAIAESGSYFLGIGSNEDMSFVEEDFNEEDYSVTDSGALAIEVDDSIKVENGDGIADDTENKIESKPWIDERIDFNKIAELEDNNERKELAKYFAGRKPSTTNEYTGMFEGYNLIYICAESFWNYACNEEVTPTLYKMANNGIVLNNYYNSFYNTTTNGEFAFATSLWPDVSRYSKNGTDIGSFAQSSTKYMPQGLGDLFTEQGIPAYGFHNYYGKYYRRILSWPNLGYKCRFTGDNMWFTSNWPASDLELVEQTVDDYINDEQFHAYYMTFSGHGPYTAKNYMYNKNIAGVTAITGTEKYNDMARGYLAGEVELDKAMEYLLKRLEQAGKLENTVIVLTGDHYPYYLDTDARDSLTGYEMDENFEIYRSNCFIYNAGITTPIQVDSYCCNIDIAPTVLNLFNIPFDSRMMIGRDIFSKEAHNRATLYNKSFITDKVKYNYETGDIEWTAAGNSMDDATKDKYINAQLNSIENEYMASCKVIDDNFFFDVYKLAGILTGEEITKEIAREENAQAMDDTFNIEDEEEKAAKEAEKAIKEAMEKAAALGLTYDPATGITTDEFGNIVDPATGLPLENTGENMELAPDITGMEGVTELTDPALPLDMTGGETVVTAPDTVVVQPEVDTIIPPPVEEILPTDNITVQ